jgi:hypothetical protein
MRVMTTYYAKSFKDLRVYQRARDVSRWVFQLSKEIGRMLHSMMAKSNAFCGSLDPTLHESTAEYFTAPHVRSPTTDH